MLGVKECRGVRHGRRLVKMSSPAAIVCHPLMTSALQVPPPTPAQPFLTTPNTHSSPPTPPLFLYLDSRESRWEETYRGHAANDGDVGGDGGASGIVTLRLSQ